MTTVPPSPQALAALTLARLEALADPARAAASQRYFKNTDNVEFYGLKSDDLRTLSEELNKAVAGRWSLKDAVIYAEALLPEKRHEARGMALLMVLKFKKEFDRPSLLRFRKWLDKNRLNNWALVDVFCPYALGTLIESRPEIAEEMAVWAESPNRWVRRASVVAFINLARRGRFLDAAYKVARLMLKTDDDLLQKANGWMLREAGKTDAGRLEAFLRKHGPAIPRTTLRYSIERFPEAKRKNLLKATRG